MSAFFETLLLAYQLPAIFLGAFFFGETAIIPAAFLSGQGVWFLSNVFLLSLAGTVVSDGVWFLFGQTIFKFTRRWSNNGEKYQRLTDKLERITGQKPYLSLLYIKFLYGVRVMTIIYLSIKKTRFWLFIVFDTIGTIFWLAVIVPVGWLAGKGIANFVPYIQQTEYILLAAVLLIIVIKLATLWIQKQMTKK